MEEQDEEFSSSPLLNGDAWEQIAYQQAQSLPESQAQSREWEMVEDTTTTVAVVESNNIDDLSIFPPGNHEGLHVNVEEHVSSVQPAPPSDAVSGDVPHLHGERLDSRIQITMETVIKQLRLGLEIFSTKIFRLVSLSRYYYATSEVSFSFATRACASVALVVSLWYLRWWQQWRRQSRDEKIDRLILLVSHQDEKMNQLLSQVSYLNELLFTRRRIPILTTT